MDLKTLRAKRRARKDLRAKHKALYRKTGKRGFALAYARDGRAMRRLRKLIAKVKREDRGTLAGVRIQFTSSGRPHWGGAADLMGQFIAPFMAAKFGLPKGSGKRTPQHNAEIGGSSTSDHLTTQILTFARDFPTFSGEAAARALAAALGNDSWQPNSFATFTVEVDGHTFQIQILWGAGIDHGDHVHVGVSLVA